MQSIFFFPKLKAEMMLCFKDLASYLINDKWYPACKTDNIRIQENNTNCFQYNSKLQSYTKNIKEIITKDCYPTKFIIENIEEG